VTTFDFFFFQNALNSDFRETLTVIPAKPGRIPKKSSKLFFYSFFFFKKKIYDEEDEEDQGTYFGLGFGLSVTEKGGNRRTASFVFIGSDLSVYQEKKHTKINQSHHLYMEKYLKHEQNPSLKRSKSHKKENL
jgi:hypothetical protein